MSDKPGRKPTMKPLDGLAELHALLGEVAPFDPDEWIRENRGDDPVAVAAPLEVIAAVNRRLDELGRLVEVQANQIRWLEAEVARVGANVQGLADDTQRERVYRQTGRLPEGRRV